MGGCPSVPPVVSVPAAPGSNPTHSVIGIGLGSHDEAIRRKGAAADPHFTHGSQWRPSPSRLFRAELRAERRASRTLHTAMVGLRLTVTVLSYTDSRSWSNVTIRPSGRLLGPDERIPPPLIDGRGIGKRAHALLYGQWVWHQCPLTPRRRGHRPARVATLIVDAASPERQPSVPVEARRRLRNRAIDRDDMTGVCSGEHASTGHRRARRDDPPDG